MDSNLVPGIDGLFCIYLGGFQDRNNEEIKEIFSEYGDVMSVRSLNDKSIHFVRYRLYDEAKRAIDAYAGNPKVNVSAAISKHKSTEDNSGSPRNNVQDQDVKMRNNRSENNQGRMRSPRSPENNKQDQNFVRSNRSGNDHQGYVRNSSHDRQFRDNASGKIYYDQDNARRNNGQGQHNDQGVRNFRGQNNFRDHRNVQNGLDSHSGGHSDNQFGRRSNDFRQNGFNNIKRDFKTSPRDNLHDKNRVNSSNEDGYKIGHHTKLSEHSVSHRGNNDDGNVSRINRVHDMKADRPVRRVTDHSTANKGNSNSKKNGDNGQINVTRNKTDRRGPKDNDLLTLVAQEVIIADLPPEIMQADLYRLCDFVNPLHIDVHRMEGDDIVYAHVFVRSREDVDMLVQELNGTVLCGKKMLVLSVESALRA